jgi:DHA1 family tetracycline resistance protein-like MFS transporter
MKISAQHKISIIALALVIFIDTLTLGLVVPIFAALFNDPQGIVAPTTSIATRNLLYSLLLSLPMVALLFGGPILGELSDRYGRRIILLFSLIGVFASCLLSISSFYLSSVLLLFISRILVALMDGSQSIAQAAIVDISLPEEKVKNLSLITLAATLGWAVGPVIGGVLADRHLSPLFGYKTPFWAAAIFALGNFFLMKYTFKETRTPSKSKSKSFIRIFWDLGKSFFDKRYFRLSIVFVLLQFSWSGLFQLVNLLLAQRFAYSAAQLGLFSTYMAVLFSVFLMTIMKGLLHRYQNITLARVGLLLLSIGLGCYLFSLENSWLVWISLIPCTAGMAMSYNTLLALFSDTVGQHEQGRVMGISLGLVAIAWLFSGLFVGHYSSISYSLTFGVEAAVAGLAFILLVQYR